MTNLDQSASSWLMIKYCDFSERMIQQVVTNCDHEKQRDCGGDDKETMQFNACDCGQDSDCNCGGERLSNVAVGQGISVTLTSEDEGHHFVSLHQPIFRTDSCSSDQYNFGDLVTVTNYDETKDESCLMHHSLSKFWHCFLLYLE